MKTLITIMLAIGSAMMVSNTILYIRFLVKGKDVLAGGNKRDKLWEGMALFLLLFFLAGYINALVSGRTPLLIAGILFGGAIYVVIMLNLLFRMVDTVKGNSLEVSELLVSMIETRDSNINGHSRYVQNVIRLFYNSLPDQYKRQLSGVNLEYAALMHNIGNIGVPESILGKNEKLSLEDWLVMYQHPKMGTQLLERLHSFDEVRQWIMYHHERVDGTGYYKLKGDEIPLASKMLAIADTYAALTSKRSYRRGVSHEEAMKVLRSVAGTQLDEQLVEFFCRLPKDELIACKPEPLVLF